MYYDPKAELSDSLGSSGREAPSCSLEKVAPTGCEYLNLPPNLPIPYLDDYCDNGWLTFLIVAAWPYVALHVVVLLLTLLRAVDVGTGGPSAAAAGPSGGQGLLANDA